MAYVSATEGGSGVGASVIHPDSSHSEYISVPDAELLFRGDFHRAGPDLVLTGHDGHHHIIPGYFSSENHPALMGPSGATLSPGLVELLAGSPAPGQYAQAQPTAHDSVGKVEKVVGDVSVMRNGVSVALHIGDAVYKSDVIQTGANSSAGIGFPDGTALNLSAGTRMALNEYSFEPNASTNAALFSLVEGTFAFVAGQVAHTGDMKIETPVATMGIRGTAGIARHEFKATTGDVVYSFLVLDEIDIRHLGTHQIGRYQVIDNRPDSPTFGELLWFVMDSGSVTYIEAPGPGLAPIVRTEAIPGSMLFEDGPLIRGLTDTYLLLNGGNPNSTHAPGSGDNPNQLFNQQFFQENGGPPPFGFNPPPAGPNGPPVPVNFPAFTPPPNSGNNTLPPSPPGPSSPIFIWDGGPGNWDAPNWSQPGAPGAPPDVVEILSGTVTFPAPDNFVIESLYIAPGATLDMTGGTLTILGGFIDGGTFEGDGDPPLLIVHGPATILSTGKMLAIGAGTEIEFMGDVSNAGFLAAEHGGMLSFVDGTVTNKPDGKIVSGGHGSVVEFTDDTVDNYSFMLATHHGEITFDHSGFVNEFGGKIEAKHHGKITFDNTGILNEFGGVIEAVGRDSRIIISGGTGVTNSGTFLADDHGTVSLHDVTVENGVQGEFEAKDHGRITFDQSDVTNDGNVLSVDRGSLIVFADGELDNSDITAAKDGGKIKFEHNESVTNEADGKIGAFGRRSTVEFLTGASLSNLGIVIAVDGGKIRFHDATVDNEHDGKIEATKGGSVTFFDSKVTNERDARIEARHHGTIEFKDSFVGNAGKIEAIGFCSTAVFSCDLVGNIGLILAEHGGAVWFTDSKIGNFGDGKIEAKDWGTITLCDSDVTNKHGAKIEAKDNGAITFEYGKVSNEHDGKIVATDHGTITFDHTDVTNKHDSTIEAKHHGTVTFEDAWVTNTDGSTIEAERGGTVYVDHTTIYNAGGVIAAIGWGSTVVLDDATIVGGTLETGDAHRPYGGVIEVVADGWHGMSVFDGSGDPITIQGFVLVDPGANLELIGTIHNEGHIDVDLGHSAGSDLIIDGTVKLDGGGAITLDGYGDEITSASHSFNSFDNFDNNNSSHSFSVLDNVDNTISGAGFIGGDDLRLDNETSGTINADRRYETLTIDTGHHEIINAGTLEASHGGILDVESDVDNSHGSIQVETGGFADFGGRVTGGCATIAGGALEFDAKSTVDVTFNNDAGYGELILRDPLEFGGKIYDFAGECWSNSDEIDLAKINPNAVHFSQDGANAEITIKVGFFTYETITLVDFDSQDLKKTTDSQGGTIVYDPPANGSSTSSVSIGGAGDNFVFHPGMGADTVANFKLQADTIQLENFANVQNAQQLAALITADAHGDAVIDLGHHDSITLPGVTTSYLQSHLQSLVHLGV